MKINIGDLVEFKWAWYGTPIVRKGYINRVISDNYFDVDCSKFQPTHNAHVSLINIISINGKGILRCKNLNE